MPRSDRIKAEIGFHERMFFSALAVIVALLAWGVENYQSVDWWILVAAVVGMFLSVGFGLWNYRQIRSLLEEFDDA